MPATFRPARARGRTATPPAAPSPITATSTGFRLMAIFCSSPGRQMIGSDGNAHVLIFWGDGLARPGVANQIPARETCVAAVIRVAERAFQSEAAYATKEGPGIWGEAGGGAVVHFGQD